MTTIRCDCGRFKAELTGFPKHSPGRLVCYCGDCQRYLRALGRDELLDDYGGTEIIPVYPSEVRFVSGREVLQCNRLSEAGLDRWSTTCCNSPIANTRPKFPWVGVIHRAYTIEDPTVLERLGAIRSRIRGKDKHGEPPFPVSETMRLKDILTVTPFLLKGFFTGKTKGSPFFKEDGVTPISEPVLLAGRAG